MAKARNKKAMSRKELTERIKILEFCLNRLSNKVDDNDHNCAEQRVRIHKRIEAIERKISD